MECRQMAATECLRPPPYATSPEHGICWECMTENWRGEHLEAYAEDGVCIFPEETFYHISEWQNCCSHTRALLEAYFPPHIVDLIWAYLG